MTNLLTMNMHSLYCRAAVAVYPVPSILSPIFRQRQCTGPETSSMATDVSSERTEFTQRLRGTQIFPLHILSLMISELLTGNKYTKTACLKIKSEKCVHSPFLNVQTDDAPVICLMFCICNCPCSRGRNGYNARSRPLSLSRQLQ